jgi:hypothetical protein
MTDAPPEKPTLKRRLSELFSEYGTIAIVTYFALSILTIIGFSVAFAIGWAPSTASGMLGVIAAGWVAAKATLPLRILITLGLTPMVAVVVTRLRRRPAETADVPDATDDATGAPPDPP